MVWPPRGGHGFGFDPMFVPDGFAATFGEMAPEAKAPLTHRTAAFAALERHLRAERGLRAERDSGTDRERSPERGGGDG